MAVELMPECLEKILFNSFAFVFLTRGWQQSESFSSMTSFGNNQHLNGWGYASPNRELTSLYQDLASLRRELASPHRD